MIYALMLNALKMRVFADISEEAWPKRRIWVNIESLVFAKELSISFINCAQEDAALISKQGVVKKKMCICFNVKATRTKLIQSILKTMFEFMLKASDLDQGVALWGIWFLCSYDN